MFLNLDDHQMFYIKSPFINTHSKFLRNGTHRLSEEIPAKNSLISAVVPGSCTRLLSQAVVPGSCPRLLVYRQIGRYKATVEWKCSHLWFQKPALGKKPRQRNRIIENRIGAIRILQKRRTDTHVKSNEHKRQVEKRKI